MTCLGGDPLPFPRGWAPLRLFSVASPLETCQFLESLQPLWPQQPAQQDRELGLEQLASCRGTAGSRAHALWKVPVLFLSFATYEDIF